MAYTVFALKWRPQNFDDIVGQAHISNPLKSALESNRLAHAYLFSGPRGVGKTSTARILAKALNCKEGPTVTPCQKCASCLDISKSRSLDVIEIDGASNRGIDEIRALRENVKFAPAGGKFKIYIIDEVHMLTTEAFNALLKTLEEPPDFVKFIFATTHPSKVIPTILSRCQRFDFRRIPTLEIIKQLERIVSAENIDIEKDVLLAVAKSSDGSLRDAESVLDQLVSFSKDKVSLKDVVSMLGLVEQEALFALTEAIIKKDPKEALVLFNRIIDEGKDISVFSANLIEHFRNLMVAKVSNADPDLIDLPADICANLLKQAGNLSLEEIFLAFNILVNTQEMSKRLDSLRIPFEIAIVKLAYVKKGANIPVSAPAARIDNVHKSAPLPPVKGLAPIKSPVGGDDNKPVFNYAQGYSSPAAETAVQILLDEVQAKWPSIIEALRKVKMSVATYLNEGAPLACSNNILTVSFPKNYSLHKESLETKENRAVIEKIISEIFSANLKINFVFSKDAASNGGNIQDNSYVKSVLDIFDGRVIREE